MAVVSRVLRGAEIYRNTRSVNGMLRRCVFRKTPMIIQLNDCQVPRSLRGPVLVDSKGLPRYWATVWSAATAGAIADSTHLKKLRYLDDLYQHADELRCFGALDDALGSLNDAALAEILESWFISIRNKPCTTAVDETRWQAGFNFVRSVVSWIAKSDSDRVLRQIDARLHQLSVLYSQFRVKIAMRRRLCDPCPRRWLKRFTKFSIRSISGIGACKSGQKHSVGFFNIPESMQRSQHQALL